MMLLNRDFSVIYTDRRHAINLFLDCTIILYNYALQNLGWVFHIECLVDKENYFGACNDRIQESV